jgi:hypothetical protein
LALIPTDLEELHVSLSCNWGSVCEVFPQVHIDIS